MEGEPTEQETGLYKKDVLSFIKMKESLKFKVDQWKQGELKGQELTLSFKAL